MTINDWLRESTPDRREVRVCLDRRLVSELVAAKRELSSIQESADGPEQMLEGSEAERRASERVASLEERVRSKARVLVFEGLGWGAWRDLVSKHPPREDQAETFERAVRLGFMPHAVENVVYDAETFVPAAIAASCVDPGMTVDDASLLLEKSPPGILERVWAAVLEANLAGADDPFVDAPSEDS